MKDKGDKNSLKNKYIACVVYHAIGDLIGFNNGKYEHNTLHRLTSPETTNALIYDFIINGGVSGFDVANLHVSDDTFMHMLLMRALLKENPTIDKFGEHMQHEFIKVFTQDDYFESRSYGTNTIASLRMLERNVPWNKIPYDGSKKGNGACMRAHAIGLACCNNTEMLIPYAVESARITHNSASGILSTYTVALLTIYALNNIDIDKWPYQLLNMLKSNKIDNYVKETRPLDYDLFVKDKYEYIDVWERYVKQRFRLHEVKEMPILNNLKERIPWFYSAFNPARHGEDKGSKNKDYLRNMGSTGDDATVFAYDCLLTTCNEGNASFETLIYMSAIHAGDSDTTGAIACGWYGAYFGIMTYDRDFELRTDLESMGKKMYEKYGRK